MADRSAAAIRLLPPDEARRCGCGKPNTTGLCAYPVGKCPREQSAAFIRCAVRVKRELRSWGTQDGKFVLNLADGGYVELLPKDVREMEAVRLMLAEGNRYV